MRFPADSRELASLARFADATAQGKARLDVPLNAAVERPMRMALFWFALHTNQLVQIKEDAMLVLTRRLGEELVIDGNIRLSIVAVNGARVRIGIVAPPSVHVERKELHDSRSRRQTTGRLVPIENSGADVDSKRLRTTSQRELGP